MRPGETEADEVLVYGEGTRPGEHDGMIRVTVELLPHGFGPPQHLGTATVANDGRGTHNEGSYAAVLSRRGRPSSAWRRTRVEGFPRRRLTAWDLLYRVLRKAVGDRNGDPWRGQRARVLASLRESERQRGDVPTPLNEEIRRILG